VSAQNGLAADVEADSTRAATDVAEEIAVGSAGAGDQQSPAELLQLAAGIAIVVVLFAAGYRSRYGDEPRPLSAMASVPAVRPARRPRRRIPAARVPASGRSGALSRDWGLSGIGGGRPVGTVSG
jgi:hypothetical protein